MKYIRIIARYSVEYLAARNHVWDYGSLRYDISARPQIFPAKVRRYVQQY